MKKNILWLLAVVLLMSSCTQRLIDFTIISSKNVPITDKGTEFQKATSRVKGVDSKWSVLFVPGVPNMKEAIDRAIEQYPGAVALTDGVVYQKSWTCFLVGQNKYIVEGTPLYPEQHDANAYGHHHVHHDGHRDVGQDRFDGACIGVTGGDLTGLPRCEELHRQFVHMLEVAQHQRNVDPDGQEDQDPLANCAEQVAREVDHAEHKDQGDE